MSFKVTGTLTSLLFRGKNRLLFLKRFRQFQYILKRFRCQVLLILGLGEGDESAPRSPRDISAMQSEAKRPSPTEERDADIAPELQGGDGADAMEEQPDEGMEPEAQAEEADVSAQSNQSKLSRSQKRRRHRK
jgi:hypothetical protein